MNFATKTTFPYFLLCLVFLFSPLEAQEGTQQKDHNAHRPWLTIFVHGNYGSFLTALSFDNILNDHYEKTSYLKVQQWLRNHIQLHHHRFLPEQGLHKINLTQSTPKNLVSAFAKSYQDALQLVDHHQASDTICYTFGWNGLLCQTARRREAITFYVALSQEIAAYKKQGINPKVRIICHSHGGNVALNLAGISALLTKEHFQKAITTKSIFKISQEISPAVFSQLDPNLCIDELVLLATPIQIETEEFVTSSLFKKVYSFYSYNDIIQIVDFVSTEGPVSNHTIAQEFLKPNVMQIHYSVIDHVKPPPPNLLVAFIKKCIFWLMHWHKTGATSKKQAFTILLKSIAAGHEANGLLSAIERAIQTITHLSNIPAEKDFDLQALIDQLQAIQKNMFANPHDPSHSDFVKTPINKKLKIVDPLPLFVWTPILCRILQEYPNESGNTAHAVLHYYDKTATITVEDQNKIIKQVEIPESTFWGLKNKLFSYLR